jgi:hypothetical protein
MKKLLVVVSTAIAFVLTAGVANACPKGTHLEGGTGPNHKGGKCVAMTGKATPAPMAMKMDAKPAEMKMKMDAKPAEMKMEAKPASMKMDAKPTAMKMTAKPMAMKMAAKS